MKFKNKLLPIFTILSTSAIVAPVITSCNNSGQTIDKDYTPSIKPYTPTEEEKDGVNADRALEIYSNAVEKDIKVHAEQMKYVIAQMLTKDENKGMTISCEINMKKFNKTNHTVSFSLNEHSKGSVKDEIGTTVAEGDITVNLEVTDLPIYAVYYGQWNILHKNLNTEWLPTTTIVGSASGSQKQNGVEIKYSGKKWTINKDTIIPQSPTTQDELEQMIVCTTAVYSTSGKCYYLKDLKSK